MKSIITLTTDFGTRDGFVAQMKGVIFGINSDVLIVDATHDIEPFSPLEAALVLNGFYRSFPRGSIHVVVVDPGVGSTRRSIAVKSLDEYFVGPDNGVFSFVYSNDASAEIREIENLDLIATCPHPTFHGRDIFAPLAAHLSQGFEFHEIGHLISDPSRLDMPPVTKIEQGLEGQVIHIDRFGNLSVNIHTEMLERPVSQIILGSQKIGGLSRTFNEVPEYQPVALINSFGLLEIAINKASAADSLGMGVGGRVRVTWRNETDTP